MINFLQKYSFFVLTTCFVCFQTVSQEITYQYYKYGVEEGLPSSEVYEVLQDKKGYIWFSTDAGVSRFNGYEFENFDISDGLTSTDIFHLYEDFKGRIWFLPHNSQLCYYEKGHIYHYKFNDKIKEIISRKWVRSISVDSNETVHFTGTRYAYGSIDKYGKLDYLLYNNSDTGMVSYFQNDNDLFVYGLKSKKESAIDVFVKGHEKQFINYKDALVARGVICQHQLSKETFLFFVGDQLCFKFKNGLKTLWFEKPILNIYVDSKKRVWLSFINNGIKIYKNIEALFAEEKPINHLFKDKNISGICEDNLNGIWLAIQNGGAYYIPNTNIEVYQLGNNELTNRVSAIHKSDDNTIYAGTFNSCIYQITDHETPKLKFKNVIINNASIHYFSIDSNNRGSLYPNLFKKIRLKGGYTWARYFQIKNNKIISSLEKTLRKSKFLLLYEDMDGRIWMSREGNFRLYVHEQDSLSLITEESGLFQYKIREINQLSNGLMLGATIGSGLLVWSGKGDKVFSIKEKNGLQGNYIRDIYIDKDDDIWLSTTKGISRLTINSQGDYTIFNMTTKHGLPSNEINSITSVSDIMWIATNKGLAKFDKHELKKNVIPPWVYIEKVVINEIAMPVQSFYDLTYDQNFIEFGFVGLTYKENGSVRYRFRMQGIDKGWIETKTRFVRYPLLSDGDYIFQIQSANEDGMWSDTKSILIKINPPYWKTVWFIILCLIAFLGLLEFIFRQRERSLRKEMITKKILEHEKLQTVSAELKALRSQMNPHFTFNTLSAIQTAVNNSDKASASRYIGDFAKLIRKVLENSKFPFISLGEELEMLKLYIELEHLRFGKKFVYEIIVAENLDLDYHEIPTMVIQPYVENAILHGLAPIKNNVGLLKIKITLNVSAVSCVIEDNGIGRVEAMKIKKRKEFSQSSMAIQITEDRIRLYKKKMKADFSVKIIDLKDNLNYAKGTRVELNFPI